MIADAREILGKQHHKAEKIPSMDWCEVPGYYHALSDSATDLAMRLLILTGACSAAIRFARVEQFAVDVWTVPADNMKGQLGTVEGFEVPLSPEAQAVVLIAIEGARDGWPFYRAARQAY